MNNVSLQTNYLKPIIKWAGGKNKILEHFKILYESAQHKRYFDLFSGSLSLPLILKPKKATFNDINIWLINLYQVIKDDLTLLEQELKKLNQDKYNCQDEFNKIRDRYNNLKKKEDITDSEKIEMAGIFIYLNKRSFNGLYRENQDGKYNVPFRQYKTSIYNKEELVELSKYFNENKIKFKSKSYRKFKVKKFKEGDLVYIDPPYYPCNKSSFTAYWKTPFLVEEQVKLAKYCQKLNKKGIKFIVSNAPCQEIKELYKDFNMKTFYIGRQMRSAEGKSDVFEKKNEDNEILIWNFNIDEDNVDV
jgi:DNA adenine methylase|tara:strand:+ start:2251 stop:3162 length:912 start_codon:yes stop_codon:yes gene_type:complete